MSTVEPLAYYNENDPFAAAWLRELIDAELIANGIVDERSIEEITPDDLECYTQCHFFAGIGVWSYALRQSGWPDDRRVWTGSCPCQPFSGAGKGAGTTDERHLWPSWFWLIEQCKPRVVFGEQVTAAIKHGWLDLVQDDLEGIGYAVGAHGLAACNLGAPHQRKRLYFVAKSNGGDSSDRNLQRSGEHGLIAQDSSSSKRLPRERPQTQTDGSYTQRGQDALGDEQRILGASTSTRGFRVNIMANSDKHGAQWSRPQEQITDARCKVSKLVYSPPARFRERYTELYSDSGETESSGNAGSSVDKGRSNGGVVHSQSQQERISRLARQPRIPSGTVAYPEPRERGESGVRGRREIIQEAGGRSPAQLARDREVSDSENSERPTGTRFGQHSGSGIWQQETTGLTGSSSVGGFWRDTEWLWCRDQKYRPVEPGTFPLASGVANRVGLLRGYGNSITAPVAQAFIEAYMQVTDADV